MLQVQYFETPSPHIIIDEFLPPKIALDCLNECIELEKHYETARTGGDNHKHEEDCEQCKKILDDQQKRIRQNDVVYLDTFFKNKRNESKILNNLHIRLMSKEVQDLFEKKGFFHILKHVNVSESILSRYGMCDFYGFHTDKMHVGQTQRMITFCYYINKEPEQFEGGDLIICGKDLSEQKKIKPKHNRAIIFQSDSTLHAVDNVKLLTDKFESGRFSVNWWLGFQDVNGIGVKFR